MATTINFKNIIDKPEWRPCAVSPNATAVGGSICSDLRNNTTRHPNIFQLGSASVLNEYSPLNDGWRPLTTPGLGGTFGAGAGVYFDPSKGPSGNVGVGSTASAMVVSTGLDAAVGVNSLGNRGDGVGYTIRIRGNSAGGSGKTEERIIIDNTSGSTPTIYLDSPLSFTPASGDTYTILSGKVYMLSAGITAATSFRAYDIATNSYASKSITNLPATISTDCSFVHLCDLYVPNLRAPGEGFLNNLVSTARTATTITGTVAGGDSAVLINEYRNFSIRIVTDTTAPTAVGQVRKITSHTAGGSPVYTVPTWTVTPSIGATFVIENFDETLLWSTASTTTYTYDSDADTWSTTTYAARGGAMAAGCVSFQTFGLTLDSDKSNRHSNVYSFRGGAVSTLDQFDIAGGATGLWSNAITYGGSGETFTTGTSLVYDPVSNDGNYAYICRNALQTMYRFDCDHQVLEPWTQLRYAQSTAVVGNKLAYSLFIDGAIKIPFVYLLRSTGTELFEILIQR